jgi:hypothetical protein
MKATHFSNSNGQGFCKIKVSFTIDSHHIILAVVTLNEYGDKISKSTIETKVRDLIFNSGANCYYHLENKTEKEIEEATEIAKKYFPSFFVDYRK